MASNSMLGLFVKFMPVFALTSRRLSTLFPAAVYGTTANTRAGKPDPPFGFGNVTTTIAPDSGT